MEWNDSPVQVSSSSEPLSLSLPLTSQLSDALGFPHPFFHLSLSLSLSPSVSVFLFFSLIEKKGRKGLEAHKDMSRHSCDCCVP